MGILLSQNNIRQEFTEIVLGNKTPEINKFRDYFPKTPIETNYTSYNYASEQQRRDNREKYYDLISVWLPLANKIKPKLIDDQYLCLLNNEGLVISSTLDEVIGMHCVTHDHIMSNSIQPGEPIEVFVHHNLAKMRNSLSSRDSLGVHDAIVFPVSLTDGSIYSFIGVSKPAGLITEEMKVLGYLTATMLEMEYNNFIQFIDYSTPFLNSLPMFALLLDKNARIINANAAFKDLLGIKSADHFLKRPISNFLHSSCSISETDGILPKVDENLIFKSASHEIIPCRLMNQRVVKTPGISNLKMLLFEKNSSSFNIKNGDFVDLPPVAPSFDRLIGETIAIKNIINLGKRIAKTKANVLLEGATGTGKELMAEAIHSESKRKGPFISINCGAIPRELIISELFGYEDGAFTGAKRGGKRGAFELANGGTIFLDEIGEMPVDMQVSLLRCLETKTITRMGSSQPIAVDVRIISATNKDLLHEVSLKNFREDLYYRLNVINIKMPLLKERREDIPLLAQYLLEKACQEMEIKKPGMDESFMDFLMDYDWPGNVRELRNTLEYAVATCQDGELTISCLPLFMHKSTTHGEPYGQQNESLERLEKEQIMLVLDKFSGDITKAAKSLGISRPTLYRKMEKFGIDRKQFVV